jgi:hypothetical protein
MHTVIEAIAILLAITIAAGLALTVWLATRPAGWRDRADRRWVRR